MKYSFKKVNDKIIKPIEVHHPDVKNILGHEIVPLQHAIIFACGRKGSGKTNIVKTLMEECINKETNVIVFCSTHNSDKNWLKIKEWLEKKEQPHYFMQSIFEDGISNIEVLVDKIMNDHSAKQEMLKAEKSNKKKKATKKPAIDMFGDFVEPEPTFKKKKSKMIAPEYFIVLDDISGELRSKKDVQILLKKHRHIDSKIVISSQFPNDLDPASRAQVDIWCLYKGFGKDKIEDIFPQLDMRDIDFEDFYNIYNDVTKVKHDFLYIDRNNNIMRKNFDQEIILPILKEDEAQWDNRS